MIRSIREVCWRGTSKTVLCLSFIYLLYLAFGGLVFSMIEAEIERNVIAQYQQSKLEFMTQYNISGYGKYSPSSKMGKLFCIMYAAVGIPLTLILFRAIADRLLFLARKLLGLAGRAVPFNVVLGPDLSLFIVTLAATAILFFLIPALAFQVMEPQWSLLDSLYYCFISMSTIGLGDLVPGTQTYGVAGILYDFASSAYIIIGVFFMSYFGHVASCVPYFNISRFVYMQPEHGDENSSLLPHDADETNDE